MHRHSMLAEFVIPELRGLPGYRKSLWLNDGGGTGTCITVFDDAEHARAGLGVLTRDCGPPTVKSGVHQIELTDP